MNYKVSIKIDGKWINCGNIKPNNFGNVSLGLRLTPELKKAVSEKETGSWLNLSLFPDEGPKQPDRASSTPNGPKPLSAIIHPDEISGEIPWEN